MHAHPGRIRLAVPWMREGFFSETLNLAIGLVGAVVAAPDSDVQRVLQLEFLEKCPEFQADSLRPSTFGFIEAATARDTPFSVLPNFVQLGWGVNAERFNVSHTGRTSCIGDALARDLWNSKRTLARAEITVPHPWVVHNVTDAERAAASLAGWPVAVKPVNRLPDGRDNGVTTGGYGSRGVGWCFRPGGAVRHRGRDRRGTHRRRRPSTVGGQWQAPGRGATKGSGRQSVRTDRGRHRVCSPR